MGWKNRPISFGALFRVYIMTHEVNMGVSSGVYECRAEVDWMLYELHCKGGEYERTTIGWSNLLRIKEQRTPDISFDLMQKNTIDQMYKKKQLDLNAVIKFANWLDILCVSFDTHKTFSW